MTRSILIPLLIISSTAFGQSIDSVTKIRFEYHKGHYPFDEPGPYAISEIIDYSLRNSNTFSLSGYLRLQKSYDSTRKTVITDTARKSISSAPITMHQAELLWNELNTTKDNFSDAFVLPHLKKPSKKEILHVAKKYDLAWKFENKYSDREDRITAFRELSAFHRLDSFLISRKPVPESVILTVDAWNVLFINFINNNNDTVRYRCNFGILLGQPVERVNKSGYNLTKRVVNLEINNAIKEVLPKKSLTGKVVDLNALKKEYIEWYLDTIM